MAYNLINIMIFIIYLHAGNSSVVIHGVFRASQARPTYCHSSSQRAVRLQRAHLLACAGPFLGRGGGGGLVLSPVWESAISSTSPHVPRRPWAASMSCEGK